MNSFLRVFIVSGIIFGVGIGVVDYLSYDNNLPIIIIYGLVSGILSGSVLGFLAKLTFKSVDASCLGNIVTSQSLFFVGLLLGIGATYGLYYGPHGQWYQILSPPEKPIRFLGRSAFSIWGGSVYIETGNGNIYSYTCDSENPCHWAKEASLPNKPIQDYLICPSGYKGPFATPVKLFWEVVDSYEANICGPNYKIQTNMVIVDNGTVWIWDRFSSAGDIIFSGLICILIGSGAGLLGYTALIIRMRKHKITDETIT